MLHAKNGVRIEEYSLIQKNDRHALYLCNLGKWWYYVIADLNEDPNVVRQTYNSYDSQSEALDYRKDVIRDWFED